MKVSLNFSSIVSLIFLTSCGQNLTGTYSGTDTPTMTVNGGSNTVTGVSIVLSLTHANNDVISGSWQSTNGTGTVLIRPSGEASVTYTLVKTFAGGQFTSDLNSGSIPCGNYVGKLSISGTQISGKLDLTQPTAISNPPQAPFSNYGITNINQVCPSSRIISVVK